MEGTRDETHGRVQLYIDPTCILLKVREVSGKNIVRESCLKLFIVSCIFASIQMFSTSTGMIRVTLHMRSAVEECREPSGNCRQIVREFQMVWRVVILNRICG